MNGADIAFPHLGIAIPTLPKGITIADFTIAYYGVIIALGMLGGLCLVRWQAKRTNQDPTLYMDYAIWGILFALVGARAYYVIFSWDSYKDNLLQIFNTRAGGMAIYGGVIGAVLTAIFFCRRRKYRFLLFADTAVVGLVLGQLIGRYGNFINREAFGEYTDSFFAMRLKVSQVSSANITEAMYEHMTHVDGIAFIQVHPTFLYESLWNLALLILMLLYTKHKKREGEIFLLYLLGYGIGRLWIEGLRTDQLQIGNTGIAISQILSALLVIGAGAYWIYGRIVSRRKKSDCQV